jgi:hypothetical protein
MKDFKFFQKKELEWYNPDEYYTVVGVTPMMYNPHTFIPSKCIMYRNITTNETIKGEVIYEGHAYWNYNE